MTESTAHLYLKERAKDLLKGEFGFQESEITTEFKIGDFKVDVVGIRANLTVAIEVGRIVRNKTDKIRFLKEHFIVVKRIKYASYVNPKFLDSETIHTVLLANHFAEFWELCEMEEKEQYYKVSKGRITIPQHISDEFPDDVMWGWRVIRNREEVRVALDKGLFDNGKMLLGEPRVSE